MWNLQSKNFCCSVLQYPIQGDCLKSGIEDENIQTVTAARNVTDKRQSKKYHENNTDKSYFIRNIRRKVRKLKTFINIKSKTARAKHAQQSNLEIEMWTNMLFKCKSQAVNVAQRAAVAVWTAWIIRWVDLSDDFRREKIKWVGGKEVQWWMRGHHFAPIVLHYFASQT